MLFSLVYRLARWAVALQGWQRRGCWLEPRLMLYQSGFWGRSVAGLIVIDGKEMSNYATLHSCIPSRLMVACPRMSIDN